MEDWALIRRLAAEGVPKARIARRLGISRTTVIKAITSDGPPKYERRPAPTSFTPYEARVRELLAETPDMPATVLAERVGWTGSIRWFRDNVNRVRADHRPIDPADRLTWTAGDVAQCDLWFPPRKILLEDGSRTLLPVLVMTCGHSRFTLGRMLPTRKTPDLLLGTWSLLDQLGRVPRRLIWDNEPGIGRGKLTEPVAVFAGTLATKVVLLPPRDPESKGLVERRNRFFETSFMPGRHFESPADFNAQFTDWLSTANARVVRTTKARPVDLLGADKDAMLPLPPAVLHLGWRNHVRLGRDYYVRVDTNDYSVDPTAIGARVDVAADLEVVRVRHGGRLVAEHPRRWARGMTVTDPAHVTAAAALRHAYQHPVPPAPDDEGMVRDLGEYDRAFGLDGQVSQP
jgi:transposase